MLFYHLMEVLNSNNLWDLIFLLFLTAYLKDPSCSLLLNDARESNIF